MLTSAKSILEKLYYKSTGIVVIEHSGGSLTTFKKQEIIGQIWFNTEDQTYYIWTGNKWNKL